MAKLIKDRHRVEEKRYSRDFNLIEDPEGGFSFPCDENGNLCDVTDAAKENFEYALRNPDKYQDMGIVTRTVRYTNNAIAECECGNAIELSDEYLGASECPYCGRWHNLFGQLLNAPSTWSSGEDW